MIPRVTYIASVVTVVIASFLVTRDATGQAPPIFQTPDARFVALEGAVESLEAMNGNRVRIGVGGIKVVVNLNNNAVSTATHRFLTKAEILDTTPLPGNQAVVGTIQRVQGSGKGPTQFRMVDPHGFAAGDTFMITISGGNSKVADGQHVATALANPRRFTVPVANRGGQVGGPGQTPATGTVVLKPAIPGFSQGMVGGIARQTAPGRWMGVNIAIGGLEQAFTGRISENSVDANGIWTFSINDGLLQVKIPDGFQTSGDGDPRLPLEVTSNRALDCKLATFQVGQLVHVAGSFAQDGLFHPFNIACLADIGAGDPGANEAGAWVGNGPEPEDPLEGLNIMGNEFGMGALEGAQDELNVSGGASPGLIGRSVRISVQFRFGGPFINQGVTIITLDGMTGSNQLGRFVFHRYGLADGSPDVTKNPSRYPKVGRVRVIGSGPNFIETDLHF